MKILLVDPYIQHFGGGEKHVFSMLSALEREGHEIHVVTDIPDLSEQIRKRLHITFKQLTCVQPGKFFTNPLSKYLFTKAYDIVFHVTDGSYFFSGSKKTFVYIMYPEKSFFNRSIFNMLKWRNTTFIADGEYTYEKMKNWVSRPVEMIYPCIDDIFFPQLVAKKKIILSVGRFFPHLHTKRQDVLIDAFKKLKLSDQFKDYVLILAGGLSEEVKDYFDSLVERAEGDPSIVFMPNIAFDELLKLYAGASYYWHASGYGIDEDSDPILVEHVGITPLEAAANGCCIAYVYNGGPKRIFKDQPATILYESIDELIEKMISTKITKQNRLDLQAYIQRTFNCADFSKKVNTIISL